MYKEKTDERVGNILVEMNEIKEENAALQFLCEAQLKAIHDLQAKIASLLNHQAVLEREIFNHPNTTGG